MCQNSIVWSWVTQKEIRSLLSSGLGSNVKTLNDPLGGKHSFRRLKTAKTLS